MVGHFCLQLHLVPSATKYGGREMLWTLFAILLVLWLVGIVTSQTLGGFLHILLFLAAIALITELALRYRRGHMS